MNLANRGSTIDDENVVLLENVYIGDILPGDLVRNLSWSSPPCLIISVEKCQDDDRFVIITYFFCGEIRRATRIKSGHFGAVLRGER
jgi:hypothetical protein